MRPLRRPRPSSQQGMILIWTVFAIFVVIGSTFVTASLSRTTDTRARIAQDRLVAESHSHAAVEAATSSIADALRIGAEPPATGTFTVDGQDLNYTIERETTAIEAANASGLIQLRSMFRVVGVGTSGRVTRQTRRLVQASVTPIFQFAIFYENDLEFYNPAPWEIHGRVHGNSDIYVRTTQPLTFDTNYLRAAGEFYGRAPRSGWDPLFGTPAEIRRWVPDPFDPSSTEDYANLATIEDHAALGVTSSGGLDSEFAGLDLNGDGDFLDADELDPFLAETLNLWTPVDPADGDQSTLQTSVHGVSQLSSPELGDLAMYSAKAGGDWAFDSTLGRYVAVTAGSGTHERGDYHDAAGLVLESYPDGTWKAFDALGIDVSADLAGAISSTTIFDQRQAGGGSGTLQQLEVDMAALQLSGRFPSNGLLFMGGYGAGTGTDVKAFTIKNAAELPAGLALASSDSIYIQGDYNTIDPKPASAMADAVNLLSNAWDNSKTPGSLPSATETTYNLSIVAGDVASTDSTFSGGPHNLPRRHEDWSGVPENLNGSIVCPFESEKATGIFQVGGTYYLPPNRFWSYDESNNDSTNLPPYTPVTVEVRASATWTAKP